jgi:aryl-alcohol dehydrogenase-like predicted oxidoreductase
MKKMNEYCDQKGTKKFSDKFIKYHKDSFKQNFQGLSLCNIGFGLYKGNYDNKSRTYIQKLITKSISSGINLFDTARKYRNGFSEKDLGISLARLIKKNKITRNQIYISSKVGLINFPDNINKKDFIETNLLKRRGIKREDIKNNLLCLSKKFINQEVYISRKNLNIKTLDNYYIHNPEFLEGRKNNYKEFYKVFECLEELVSKKKINAYGISTWNGFRRFKSNDFYIDAKKIINIAKKVGGENNNFLNFQIPLSVCMPFTKCSYIVEGQNLFDFLLSNKKNIFTSASLYEGKIISFFNLLDIIKNKNTKNSLMNNFKIKEISLPASDNSILQLFQTYEMYLRSKNNINLSFDKKPYLKALDIVRSTKGVTSSLCGMENEKQLLENLNLLKKKKISPKKITKFWSSFF